MRNEVNLESFYRELAGRLTWFQKHILKLVSFKSPVKIEWFKDGELNVSVNCLDRHLPHKANQTAFIWEADDINAKSKYMLSKTL